MVNDCTYHPNAVPISGKLLEPPKKAVRFSQVEVLDYLTRSEDLREPRSMCIQSITISESELDERLELRKKFYKDCFNEKIIYEESSFESLKKKFIKCLKSNELIRKFLDNVTTYLVGEWFVESCEYAIEEAAREAKKDSNLSEEKIKEKFIDISSGCFFKKFYAPTQDGTSLFRFNVLEKPFKQFLRNEYPILEEVKSRSLQNGENEKAAFKIEDLPVVRSCLKDRKQSRSSSLIPLLPESLLSLQTLVNTIKNGESDYLRRLISDKQPSIYFFFEKLQYVFVENNEARLPTHDSYLSETVPWHGTITQYGQYLLQEINKSEMTLQDKEHAEKLCSQLIKDTIKTNQQRIKESYCPIRTILIKQARENQRKKASKASSEST